MKRKNKLALAVIGVLGMLALLLTACGNSSAPASTSSSTDLPPANDAEYAEYAGYQFSGEDPWEGELSITIRSIVDGKMDWTFTDTYENHELYQEMEGTAIHDGVAEYDIEGKDLEHDNESFSYQGTMELKDGKVIFTFETGAVSSESPEGGDSYRFAQALKDSGLSNQVILDKVS